MHLRLRHVLSPAVACALLLPVQLAAQTETARRSVVVSGTGTVSALPDRAELTLGVAERAERAEAALDAMGEAMRRVIEALSDAGIDSASIQTSDLWLGQVQRSDGARNPTLPPLFEARSLVSIETDDMEGTGALIDRVARLGANRIRSVRFTLADPGPLEDTARRAAVADAIDAARTYADAAGVVLGDVVAITDQGAGGPRPMASRAFDSADGVPVAAGVVEVTASVRLEIEIAD